MLSTRRYRHALVLGKFYPPHAGHHHLIRTAAKASERTTVAVLAATVESIPLADRVYWLAAEHWADPGVAVLGDIDDHPIDLHDAATWELHVRIGRAAGRSPRPGWCPSTGACTPRRSWPPSTSWPRSPAVPCRTWRVWCGRSAISSTWQGSRRSRRMRLPRMAARFWSVTTIPGQR